MMMSRYTTAGTFKAATRRRAHSHGSPARVLVAEDDPEMRWLVVTALRQDGYEVLEAADGGRLLVLVTGRYLHPGEEVDLIVSDICMPTSSGLQILKGLRDAHWTVPVILMTAFGDDETRARAEHYGALLFEKPFDIDDLRTAVSQVLA